MENSEFPSSQDEGRKDEGKEGEKGVWKEGREQLRKERWRKGTDLGQFDPGGQQEAGVDRGL